MTHAPQLSARPSDAFASLRETSPSSRDVKQTSFPRLTASEARQLRRYFDAAGEEKISMQTAKVNQALRDAYASILRLPLNWQIIDVLESLADRDLELRHDDMAYID